MGEPFVGEIKLMGFGWPPRDYAQCDGALMPVTQNQSLYSLLGINYGGDGRTTFGLPDMRGRTPVGQSGLIVGKGGFESVTLSQTQIAGHRHRAYGMNQNGNRPAPSETTCFANSPDDDDLIFGEATDLTPMKADLLSPIGYDRAHANLQPSLAINFCIALAGLYPSRN